MHIYILHNKSYHVTSLFLLQPIAHWVIILVKSSVIRMMDVLISHLDGCVTILVSQKNVVRNAMNLLHLGLGQNASGETKVKAVQAYQKICV